jgi:hypothetical protein
VRSVIGLLALCLAGCKKSPPVHDNTGDAAVEHFPTHCFAFTETRGNPYDTRSPIEPRWPERMRPRVGASVTMGTPTIVGIISNDNVGRVLRDFPGLFEVCYMDRVSAEVQSGQPRMVLAIGERGLVVTSKFLERGGVPDDVAWCMTRYVCRSSFYAPETQNAIVEIPFTVVPTID